MKEYTTTTNIQITFVEQLKETENPILIKDGYIKYLENHMKQFTGCDDVRITKYKVFERDIDEGQNLLL